MKTTILIVTTLLLAGLCVLAGFAPDPTAPETMTAPEPAPALAATTYKVDSVHSNVLFGVEHLGVSTFYGRFNDVSGSYTFDPDDAGACKIDIVVQAESVDSNSEGRDNHLKTPDFFNAKEFPTIEFHSTSMKKTGDDTYEATGKLALHGVTKPMTVVVRWMGEGDKGPRFGYRSGFETMFTIKRTDFGMDTYVKEGVLGDEVDLIVGIEGIRE